MRPHPVIPATGCLRNIAGATALFLFFGVLDVIRVPAPADDPQRLESAYFVVRRGETG